MKTIILLIAILIIAAIVLVKVAIASEKKAYNNGICPICSGKLYMFDVDSRGARGYACEQCHYHTWILYSSVDGFKLNEQKNDTNI